ncbi:aminotransferase, LLPSF_NHT_00031 family [Anaerocolumna jejuensis DSM 15929]|uniref:Aminotransferase, LLPSF_NHT_00031 family n=1 Tax=Anaerocolumna jejuensis DSM 15929 TaxID=1121322 RepID=A0A1M7B4I8_9FIRM|nr:LegC family aminotransferase [Anaerocolumna jejuensis]SHL49935.1 aminotransferase, LLPSF_NHT_00031 family [Anaerocolumna jejuensis DSM 15929]
MDKFIPLSVPNLKGREVEYVTTAVETEWVSTGGPYVNEFEEKIAQYVHSEGAVSCQNGTSGIHVALQVCGVTGEDEVIVPTLTFIAAVNPVKYIHADTVFMDCDDSLTMDPDKLMGFMQRECIFTDRRLINKRTNKQIKAIIVVHVFGNLADMEVIMKIADEFNLIVIEDATEALGTYYKEGRYKGKYAGTIGTVGIYSFNGNKIITTGGGGMIVSANKELLRRAKHLTTQAKSDELYFIHDEIGYNYRMTNLQAALGLAQLEQLEDFIITKKKNYELYQKNFRDIQGLSLMDYRSNTRWNSWFYSMFCDDTYPMNRDEVIRYLSSKGIQARPVWGLIHTQGPYLDSQNYYIEKAEHYLKHIVNIPCSSNLSEEDLLYVVECLKV